jgi:hypothetical protein
MCGLLALWTTKFMTHIVEFYVLLTVLHLGIILVSDQLDAQFFFFVCLFQFCTCFEQPHAHHQENQFYQYNIWCVSPTRTRCRIYIIDSPNDEYEVARNM